MHQLNGHMFPCCQLAIRHLYIVASIDPSYNSFSNYPTKRICLDNGDKVTCHAFSGYCTIGNYVEHHVEHVQILMKSKLLMFFFWDMQSCML